jgi:hypothetical protein
MPLINLDLKYENLYRAWEMALNENRGQGKYETTGKEYLYQKKYYLSVLPSNLGKSQHI